MMAQTTEDKALALMNEVNVERGYTPYSKFDRDFDHTSEALCRAIEQHEAFRQEVSDAVEVVVEVFKHEVEFPALERFIIPKPKPDPLVEAWKQQYPDDPLPEASCNKLRAALDARGLTITTLEKD